MRRVNITGGNLTLMDYCTAGPQFASGGFIADSKTGTVDQRLAAAVLRPRQQHRRLVQRRLEPGLLRRGGRPGAVLPEPALHHAGDAPRSSREKPYLYVDARGPVPASSSPRSARTPPAPRGPTARRRAASIPLSDFFVARPGDSVQTINTQLARGKNLLLTPGVYDVDQTIEVKRADTVVLGLGFATLTAVNGAVPLTVADVPGVDIAGSSFDAGPVNSPVLLQIGTARKPGTGGRSSSLKHSDPADPTTLQDVFFRIGGPHVGKATVSLVVNSDNVILDDIWAWRADHGNGVGWTVNTADTGVVVNGDDVTATGLFVEHYQKYNVIWNGENGKTIFFQNEMPYDPPNQAAWQHDGVLGWAGYKVADSVKTHELWGGGSYIYTNVDPTIHATRGFEVPVTPGVQAARPADRQPRRRHDRPRRQRHRRAGARRTPSGCPATWPASAKAPPAGGIPCPARRTTGAPEIQRVVEVDPTPKVTNSPCPQRELLALKVHGGEFDQRRHQYFLRSQGAVPCHR